MFNKNLHCLNFGYITKVIPLAFNESMSYLECIYAIQYALNETIKQVKDISKFLENFDVNLDDFDKRIKALETEMTNLNLTIKNLEASILKSVDEKLKEQNAEVLKELQGYETIFNNNLAILKTDLEKQIKEIELGNVQAYNPTTGTYTSVSQAIDDVYNASRQYALTASEFDSLELTAENFDSKNISAFNFDNNGKTLLSA